MAKSNLDELLEQSEEAIKKGEDLGEFEVEHHGKTSPKSESPKSKVEGRKKKVEGRGKKVESPKSKVQSPKVEDKTENEEEKVDEKAVDIAGEKKEKKVEKPTSKKQGKKKVRSEKYQKAIAQVDRTKKYSFDEAIALAKKTNINKDPANVEVHLRMLSKNKKPEQIRGLLNYPHETGKKTVVIILDEKKIEEIAKTKKIDFDVCLVTPEMMPKIGKLAKILGPKGKMPNPKSGTITADPEKTKKEMAAGQVEYKTDDGGNIHQVIGKTSANDKDLTENYDALISVLPKEKIAAITICTTMGPGIKVLTKI